jgi:hypothetical protein
MTPSGIAVKFDVKPYRRYFLMPEATPEKMLDDSAWGKKVESVTSVLKVLDKPALPWWGMEIGVAGVLESVARGNLSVKQDGTGYDFQIAESVLAAVDKKTEAWMKDHPGEIVTDAKRIAQLLTVEKLTTNHVRDAGGKRGTNAHHAFETWCETGILPAVDAYVEEQQGYVQAIHSFVQEADLTTGRTEIMVGSPTHRFAGRYDWHGMYEGIPSLLDVKTSKFVGVSHMLQQAGYEGARRECGYRPTERQGIIHAKPDGTWNVVWSHDLAVDGQPVTYEDFLAVLRVARVCKRLGGL